MVAHAHRRDRIAARNADDAIPAPVPPVPPVPLVPFRAVPCHGLRACPSGSPAHVR